MEAATDSEDFEIKTAALSYYAQSNTTPPSLFVDSPNDPIRDSSGQLEPLFD